METAFSPGPVTQISASSSSARARIKDDVGTATVRVANPSANGIAHIRNGNSTVAATTADLSILPGTVESFTFGGTHMAVILEGSNTGTVEFCVGQGI